MKKPPEGDLKFYIMEHLIKQNIPTKQHVFNIFECNFIAHFNPI